jgi:putative endonuclease
MERGGCVYIITNVFNTVMYIGVTSDLFSRITEHKNKIHPKSFTAKYNCNKLVYYEMYPTIDDAIGREKKLKKWNKE